MAWDVTLHTEFEPEFAALSEELQDKLLGATKVLIEKGPMLGRPLVDTLKGSKIANLKEIRITATDGEYRFAFAFDTKRQAIILCGGSKSGIKSDRFYKDLIAKAEARFGQ